MVASHTFTRVHLIPLVTKPSFEFCDGQNAPSLSRTEARGIRSTWVFFRLDCFAVLCDSIVRLQSLFFKLNDSKQRYLASEGSLLVGRSLLLRNGPLFIADWSHGDVRQ